MKEKNGFIRNEQKTSVPILQGTDVESAVPPQLGCWKFHKKTTGDAPGGSKASLTLFGYGS